VAAPRAGGSICTRSFIPHVCHDAIGVLAAVTVATACVLDGSVAQRVASVPQGGVKKISVEHPTGEFSVEIEVDRNNPQNVTRAALLRTARLLMRGEVMVSGSVWAPRSTLEHDPEKRVAVFLGTNAARLPGDHAQTKR